MVERDDRGLDDYLRGGSPLSAAYREARGEEPSADLDEVLLERARREMHLGPKVAWSPFTRSWSLPLALAAVLVVSVTVTLVLHEQTGEPLPVPAKPAAEAPAPGPDLAPAKKMAPAPAARPAPVPGEAPEGARAPAAPVPFPAEDNAPVPREQRATATESGPAASTERPAAIPALQDAPRAQALEKQAAEVPAVRAKTEAARQKLAKDDDLGADPDAWARRIEALRKEGRNAEADALLAEFRKRFPDYPADKLPK